MTYKHFYDIVKSDKLAFTNLLKITYKQLLAFNLLKISSPTLKDQSKKRRKIFPFPILIPFGSVPGLLVF